jgi:hypothetical protein
MKGTACRPLHAARAALSNAARQPFRRNARMYCHSSKYYKSVAANPYIVRPYLGYYSNIQPEGQLFNQKGNFSADWFTKLL